MTKHVRWRDGKYSQSDSSRSAVGNGGERDNSSCDETAHTAKAIARAVLLVATRNGDGEEHGKRLML